MEFRYNNGLENAGRTPRLYLAKGGEIKKFAGENVEGWCAVVTAKYTKCGKWSNTQYSLDLAAGVRPLYFLSPMHGTWGDDLASWGEVAERLGLPVDVAQTLIRAEYKSTAERLDKLEEFALAVEAQGATTETVMISFGSPTNRQIASGWWKEPKSGQTSDGRKVVIAGEPDGEYAANWDKPMVVEPEGAKVLSSRHSPGMHGGY